jgi:hypothetical protein
MLPFWGVLEEKPNSFQVGKHSVNLRHITKLCQLRVQLVIAAVIVLCPGYTVSKVLLATVEVARHCTITIISLGSTTCFIMTKLLQGIPYLSTNGSTCNSAANNEPNQLLFCFVVLQVSKRQYQLLPSIYICMLHHLPAQPEMDYIYVIQYLPNYVICCHCHEVILGSS